MSAASHARHQRQAVAHREIAAAMRATLAALEHHGTPIREARAAVLSALQISCGRQSGGIAALHTNPALAIEEVLCTCSESIETTARATLTCRQRMALATDQRHPVHVVPAPRTRDERPD